MARPGTGGGRSSGGFSQRRSGSSSGRSSSGRSSSGRSSSSSGRSSGGSSLSRPSGRSSSSSSSSRSSFGSGRSSSSPRTFTTGSSRPLSSSGSTNTRSSGGRRIGSTSGYTSGYTSSTRSSNQEQYHEPNNHQVRYRKPRIGFFQRQFYNDEPYYDEPYYDEPYYDEFGGYRVLTSRTLIKRLLIIFSIIILFVGFVFINRAINQTKTSYNRQNDFSYVETEKKETREAETIARETVAEAGKKVIRKSVRIPLSTDRVVETSYYHDDLGWIEEPKSLLDGMRLFYSKTGIQPYLGFVKPVSATNTDEECNAYTEQLYDQLFEDEGHLLLIYVENLDPDELGYLAYVCGSDAVSIMDDEAIDTLYQYVDQYWFNEDYTTEQVFAYALQDTAMDIMPGDMEVGGWVEEENGWRFKVAGGEVITDLWAEINGIIYYFTPEGIMATGWYLYEDQWYYFHESGEMLTGWVEVEGKWYYLDDTGACLMDTVTPDGYQVDDTGAMIE